MDGFGVASPADGNAIAAAHPRNLDFLINNYPATTLQASGPAVGLPWGERGNSEVGHLNLGAGRIVDQDFPRINKAIASGEFFQNAGFMAAIDHVKKNNSRLHLIGLLSDGGIHSSEEHLYALLNLVSTLGLKDVIVHMFTDGRDASPKSALGNLGKLTRRFFDVGVGKVGSIVGRFYAMDRGLHWELTESAYKAIVLGEGQKSAAPRQAILDSYARQITDEIIPPTVIVDTSGEPIGRIREGDAAIFFNFRPDRMVQLVRAITDPHFDKFSKQYPYLQNIVFVTMTSYQKDLAVLVAFPGKEIHKGLSEVLSVKNFSQFHIAESEKYSHVTSFFNGGLETPWPNEEREIITSPGQYQKRYEDVPEMRADEIGQRVIQKLREGINFILANFANPDMVGHTANMGACIRAVRAVDANIGRIFETIFSQDACLVITADHGNIEQIVDSRLGTIDTEHTANPVPLVIAGNGWRRREILSRGYLELPGLVPEGVLSDVAPTILELFGIAKPEEMSSSSLVPLLNKFVEP